MEPRALGHSEMLFGFKGEQSETCWGTASVLKGDIRQHMHTSRF